MNDTGSDDPKAESKGLFRIGCVSFVGFLASCVSIYTGLKAEAPSLCYVYEFKFCNRNLTEPTEPPPTGEPVSPSVNGGLAISIQPAFQHDSAIASRLNSELRGALGQLASAADGYIIKGKVSNFANGSSGQSSFIFSWSMKKGLVEKSCDPIAVSYPSQMSRAATNFVADNIRPAISRSVNYQEVRCK